MTDRYKVIGGSESGHCCFAATVVDTSRPLVFHGTPYAPNGDQKYESVCECFETPAAERICLALNQQDTK